MQVTLLTRIILYFSILLVGCNFAYAQDEFALKTGDVVVFTGGENMLHLQQSGHFEGILTQAFAAAKPKFRDLSWEADTVFRQGSVLERWRREGFGNHNEQFKHIGATVVIAQFGRLESMAGEQNIAAFSEAYNALINDYQKQASRVILVSPTPFEKPTKPFLPDVSKHNKALALYVKATANIASRRKLLFVDLFTGIKAGLTENGMHIKPEAQQYVAELIANQLEITLPSLSKLETLRAAIIEKHRLWYDYWRPANWKLLYGDDSRRQFTKRSPNYIPFREEWKRLIPLIEKAEQRIWTIADGGKDPGHNRPAPEILYGDKLANIKVELQSFKVIDGLTVNLFASDKEGLTSPLGIRWDTSGRMYVTVTTTYPHVYPGDVPNDKIVILEDTDQDGTADNSWVFAENLNIPTGIELGDGGVYVGQSTEIIFLMDTTGDGKADLRRVVLSGFGSGDSHQTINSFIWSPGGELYMGQGDGIESRVETPWGSSDLYQAGVYRLRPRRLQLHALLDGFMGPANPWGVAFDNWGQMFTVDGAGGVDHLSLGQIPTSHRLKLRAIGDPGGYCGITHLDGRHLPQSLQGQFIVGDFKTNRVKRFSLESDGAGFQLKWETPLLQSSHRNFRPVDMRVGPDGAIYIVDWYNTITCHQDDAYRDPRRDKAHGRIWRIASNLKTIRTLDLAEVSMQTVLNALKSPERWMRYQAKRELTQRDTETVATALKNWIGTLDDKDEQYEHHLYEALGAYATIEVVEPNILKHLLQAKEPRARAFAARITGRWHDRLDSPLDWLAQTVEDENALVRMESVAAAAAIPSPQSIQIVVRAADHPIDKHLDYVFTQAIHHLKPLWEPAFHRGELRFAKSSHLAAVMNKAGSGDLIDSLRTLADSTDLSTEARCDAISTLLEFGGPKDFREYGLNIKRFSPSGKYDAALHSKVLRKLIKTVEQRQIKPTGDPSDLLNRLLNYSHQGLQTTVLTLAGLWQVSGTTNRVSAAATNKNLPLEVRAAAFKAMAQLDSVSALKKLIPLSSSPNSPSLRATAIQALCIVDLGAAAEQTALLFSEAKGADLNPTALINTILSRTGGVKALIEALGSVTLQDIFAAHVLQLFYETGRADQGFIDLLKNAAGIVENNQPYSKNYVNQLIQEVETRGNATRGKTHTASCLACHRIGKTGGIVGPDLTSIGTALSADRITEELLWPSRQVKEGYTLLEVTTIDGQLQQGFERLTKESAKTGDLVLRQLATETLVTFKKDQIASRQELGSAMPTGLTADMTHQQLLDLIQYLTTLGRDR